MNFNPIDIIAAHPTISYAIFSAVVSLLPPPLENERWYKFAYDILHVSAMNLPKVFKSLRIERAQ
jgi:hypothetical protein